MNMEINVKENRVRERNKIKGNTKIVKVSKEEMRLSPSYE